MFEQDVWELCDELDVANYKLKEIKLLVDDALGHYFSHGHNTIVPTLEKIRGILSV